MSRKISTSALESTMSGGRPPRRPAAAAANPAAVDPVLLLAQILAAQQQAQAARDAEHVANQQQQALRDAQLAEALVRLANQNAQPKSNRKLTDFNGSASDDVDDWIHTVEREASAGNWTDETKLNMA